MHPSLQHYLQQKRHGSNRDVPQQIDVVHVYKGILLSHRKECNTVICSDMDGSKGYHIK